LGLYLPKFKKTKQAMRKSFLTLLAVVCLSLGTIAQNRSVSGKITDEKGIPIEGVSVTSPDNKVGTKTDKEGKFIISVPASVKTLLFSSVNFETQSKSIGSSATVNISLVSKDSKLAEVVVTGYGRQRKANITSAQTKVGGEKVENVPFASVDQILQGKVAGLNSVTNSGQPGSTQQIRIRGIGSISASAQPLFVVDGIQINTGDLSRTNTTANTLAGINPDDIERIDVLKDAGATAIYGSRGSNGVILITTKKGKAGKTIIKASSEIGYNNFVNAPENSRPLKAAEWLALLKEGLTNANIAPATITTTLHNYGADTTISTDWFDLLTRTGKQQQFNLSASGGNEKTTFYSSVGYFNQEASLLASSLKRFNGSINVHNQASKNLAFDLSISGSYQNQNSPLGGSSFSNPVSDIYFLRPTQSPYNADGSLTILRTNPLNFSTGFTHNPLYTLSKNVYNTRTTQFKPILGAEYTIMKGLKYSGKYGIDYNNLEEFKYYNPNNGDGVSVNGSGSALYTRYFLQDFTSQLDYHVGILGNDLTADVKVGYENVNSKYFGITAAANTYSNDKLLDLVNASVFSTATSNQADYRFVSTFSNAVLNYKNRYILTGSFRRDGSSRFGPNNKYGNFYAFGASWNASEEAFFQNQKAVSFLKFRGSYGLSGNAEIGNYAATAQQNSGYNYGGAAGTAFETIGNESLSWEKNNTT
jgi:TonB-linked SusC/RagA family outer membrane protein